MLKAGTQGEPTHSMHLKDKRSREKKNPCLEVFAAQRSPCLSKNAGSRLLTHTSYFRFTSKSDIREHEPDVCFGPKADICSAKRHVRFIPNTDRESRHPQTVMSALPPIADMCGALPNVR